MPQRSMQQLLEIRLDALKLDVGKVREVVQDARKRTSSIRDIKRRLEYESADGGREALRQIRSLARRVDNVLEDSPQLREELDTCDRGLADALSSELPEYLARLKELLDSVQRDIGELDHDMVDLPDVQTGPMESSLEARCDDVCEQIGQLQVAASISAAGRGTFRDLWDQYDRMLKEDARPLFAEYVDFAGGLAVRDNALDNRVCQMTDVLLKDLSHVTMYPLSVPARQAALGTVMKSVIKLGFPEWTIWGIPLVGHELGLSVADNEEVIKRLVNGDSFGMSADRKKSLFADIFATYTLGPAYACAAILLRFEPHHASSQEGDPSDIDRAWLILDVLDRLGDTAPGGCGSGQVNSYFETVGRLRELWEGAVANLTEPNGGPSAGTQRQADLEGFLAATWRILSDSSRFHAFDCTRWLAAQEWLADLKGSPKRTFRRETNEVLDLLTAAWRARLEDAEHTTPITKNAGDLWLSAPDVAAETVRRPGGLNRPQDSKRKATK